MAKELQVKKTCLVCSAKRSTPGTEIVSMDRKLVTKYKGLDPHWERTMTSNKPTKVIVVGCHHCKNSK